MARQIEDIDYLTSGQIRSNYGGGGIYNTGYSPGFSDRSIYELSRIVEQAGTTRFDSYTPREPNIIDNSQQPQTPAIVPVVTTPIQPPIMRIIPAAAPTATADENLIFGIPVQYVLIGGFAVILILAMK